MLSQPLQPSDPLPLLPVVLLSSLLTSCSSALRPSAVGPTRPVAMSTESWSYDGRTARTLRTPRYLIHTTVTDEKYLEAFAQTMEGAHDLYRALAPDVTESSRPLECFVFATRPEWAQFTRDHTGDRADFYLQIRRGAYAINDWYVSYYLGDLKSLSIAAHEGFHQYVGRNFVGRLPPFLEEGTACLFETVTLDRGLPRWDLSVNLHRAQSLRNALQGHQTYPLSQLIGMHAGNVIQERGDRIEAFYAQSWAFARFLQDADGGKYRPAFQKLLADTAAGTVVDPTGTLQHRARGWNPAAARITLEHYLNLPLPQIEARYQAYMQDVAFTHFADQWRR